MPNILYVRDAIWELDKKKAAEIDKIWKSQKRSVKKLLKDIEQRLEQPYIRSSSPIVQPQETPTSNKLYIVDPKPSAYPATNY